MSYCKRLSSLKSIIYLDVEPGYQVEILDYVLSITYDLGS